MTWFNCTAVSAAPRLRTRYNDATKVTPTVNTSIHFQKCGIYVRTTACRQTKTKRRHYLTGGPGSGRRSLRPTTKAETLPLESGSISGPQLPKGHSAMCVSVSVCVEFTYRLTHALFMPAVRNAQYKFPFSHPEHCEGAKTGRSTTRENIFVLGSKNNIQIVAEREMFL